MNASAKRGMKLRRMVILVLILMNVVCLKMITTAIDVEATQLASIQTVITSVNVILGMKTTEKMLDYALTSTNVPTVCQIPGENQLVKETAETSLVATNATVQGVGDWKAERTVKTSTNAKTNQESVGRGCVKMK